MRYLSHLIGLALVGLIGLAFMLSAHYGARQDAIAQLYSQEQILAGQAARSIEDYFNYHKQTLHLLASNAHVIKIDKECRDLMQSLFTSNTNNFLSVTRVGSDGRIAYTFPDESAIGQDVSAQAHIRMIFNERKPVVSDVFKAVQGFNCVALHVPVFDNGQLAGSLAILFSFETLSKRYLDGIKAGQTGYAFLLSEQGIELYRPISGNIGNRIQDSCRNQPTILDMAEKMQKGLSGTAIYAYEGKSGLENKPVLKHAFYTPIRLENTFWSICISAPEQEALAFIRSYSERWGMAVAIVLTAFGIWGYFLVHAFAGMQRRDLEKRAQEKIILVQKENEQALRDSETKFRGYFENSLLAMAITSPEKNWLVVNDRLCDMLGYSREELMTKTWADLTHPDDLGSDVAQFHRMLSGHIQGYSLEKRFVRKDKTAIDTILSVSLLRRPNGAPDYCLAQVQDITARKKAETERAKLEEQLRQSQKMEAIGQLAGGVAHDFNNLLTIQLGSIEFLKEAHDLPQEYREALKDIESSAERAAALTGQLLAFSRQQILKIKRIDLNQVLADFNKMLRRIIREDIDLEMVTVSQPLWIDADTGMMEQVLMNLAVNARDAMPRGGRLVIQTDAVIIPEKPASPEARPGKFVRLTVSDTGCGMSSDTLKHIYEPFFTTKEIGKGTGLGMATVYGIVKQHHGWIDAQSAIGSGTVFRIHVPAASIAAPTDPNASSNEAAPRGNGQTLLLVEDDLAVRLVTRRFLSRLGYKLLEAGNSREALEIWSKHHSEIAMLLSDMVMPNSASGLEIARQLRAQNPALPVILMSGHSFDLAQGGIPEDMIFLPKPCISNVLAVSVWKCLNP